MSSSAKAVSLILAIIFGLPVGVASAGHAYVPGEVVVKYKGSRPAVVASLAADSALQPVNGGIEKIILKQGLSVETALAILSARDDIVYAQPNYLKRSQTIPDDPLFNVQWAIKNDGQVIVGVNGDTVAGFADADIDGDVAWNGTTGDAAVIVAVLDSGVDYTHPDITNNVWHNLNEAKDGVDDDGNGYVDDVMGWDFVHNDNDPIDLNGHGTHVAGIIAARGNDGSTIAGMAWQSSIMALQVVDADGVTTSSAIVSAIHYAVDNGAKIINASYGETTFDQAEYDAISYANDNGVLVVAAACNNGVDIDDVNNEKCYPASYDLPNIIAVAASDQFDNRAVFSNWGATSVDLAAPGVSIVSTYPNFDRVWTSSFVNGVQGWTFGGSPNQWGISGAILQDSPHGNYGNNANNWAMSPAIDLSGHSDCRIAVDFFSLNIEDNIDTLIIETSSDANSWSVAGEVRSAAQLPGGKYYADITAFDNANPFYFRFRFHSNNSVVFDGVAINSAGIDCYGGHDQNSYAYLGGTSVAAPFVSGTAALMLAQSGTLSVSEIRDRILSNVDKPSALNGLVSSGGRLNAAKALGLAADNVPVASGGGGGGDFSMGILVTLIGFVVGKFRKPEVFNGG